MRKSTTIIVVLPLGLSSTPVAFGKMHNPHRGRTYHEERERDYEYNEMRLGGAKIPIGCSYTE